MATRKKSSKRRLQARRRFNRIAAIWLVGITVVVGVFVVVFSHAAGSGKMYIDPSSIQVLPGSTVQVTVHEDSGVTPVNAVQADIAYSTSTLDYVGADGTGSAFGVEAPTTPSDGMVSFTRGTITPVTGDQPVVKLTFRVKSGSSNVAIRNTSALVGSGSNANILGSTTGTTLGVLDAGAGATPTPVPAATATPQPVATPVATLVPSTTSTSTVNLPAVSNVPAGSTTTYAVDGQPVTGSTVDGSTISNGDHTVTSTTTDPNGTTVQKATSTVKVSTNKSFADNVALVFKENAAAVILVIVMIAVAIGGFIFWRRNLNSSSNSLSWPS